MSTFYEPEPFAPASLALTKCSLANYIRIRQKAKWRSLKRCSQSKDMIAVPFPQLKKALHAIVWFKAKGLMGTLI